MSSRMPSAMFRPGSVYPKIEGAVLCQSVIFPGQQHHCVLLPHCIQGLHPNFSSQLLNHCFDGWAPWETLLRLSLPPIQGGSKWVLSFRAVLTPALGKTRRGRPALHCRIAGGRGGKEGRGAAVGLLLSPAASACSARPKGLKACLWGGAGGGGRRSGVPRSIPCLPEPPRTRSRERRGAAVPSAGSCLLCHFPGAIPGNYPYLWQENRLLMHQHSCFDTFDE